MKDSHLYSSMDRLETGGASVEAPQLEHLYSSMDRLETMILCYIKSDNF